MHAKGSVHGFELNEVSKAGQNGNVAILPDDALFSPGSANGA